MPEERVAPGTIAVMTVTLVFFLTVVLSYLPVVTGVFNSIYNLTRNESLHEAAVSVYGEGYETIERIVVFLLSVMSSPLIIAVLAAVSLYLLARTVRW